MTGWLSRMFQRTRRPGFPDIAPDAPFYVIGDVHGQASLLDSLLDRLDPALMVVLVGDCIDRGEHSARVLRTLSVRPRTRCLRGNHEAMLQAFLEDPQKQGPRWLRQGGLQTLASFGIAGVTPSTTGSRLDDAATQLRHAMGEDLIRWLAALPDRYISGNVAVVHAGADPGTDLVKQDSATLIWGHADFLRQPRRDGIWVVHGHTIVPAPSVRDGRIAIDTGAYVTGTLTAALIAGGRVSFLST